MPSTERAPAPPAPPRPFLGTVPAGTGPGSPTTADTPTPTPTPAPVRASHAEREHTVTRLHDALGEGRLDLAEVEPRVAAAYAAQYRHELPPLLADLPPGEPGGGDAGAGAPTWTQLWAAVVWRARTTLLGTADRPTPGQCRVAARLAALALVWLALWAFVGAAVIA